MELSFSRAEVSDIPELIEIQNAAFYDDYLKYGHCPTYGEAEERMREHLNNLSAYKILLDGRIIGDIMVRRRENNCYYLRVIAIKPEYCNLGIGTKAIEFIEQDNPDAVEWSLITPHENMRNHHFYEKFGYKKVGEIVDSDILTLWEYKKTCGIRV